MKKLVSLLVVLTMLVACFATSAFAANSPVGNVTVKEVAGIEVEGLTEAESDKIADEFKLEVSTEAWVDPIKTTAGITEKLGEVDYKLFQGAKLVLSDEGEALLGDKTVKTATVTLNVPGVTEANAKSN